MKSIVVVILLVVSCLIMGAKLSQSPPLPPGLHDYVRKEKSKQTLTGGRAAKTFAVIQQPSVLVTTNTLIFWNREFTVRIQGTTNFVNWYTVVGTTKPSYNIWHVRIIRTNYSCEFFRMVSVL